MKIRDEKISLKTVVMLVFLIASMVFVTSYYVFNSPTISMYAKIVPDYVSMSVGQTREFYLLAGNGTVPYTANWFANDTWFASGMEVSFTLNQESNFNIRVVVKDAKGNLAIGTAFILDPATINIYLNDLPNTATYIMKTDGTNYWAVKYDGSTLWGSTNASYTIQSAIISLTYGGKIFFTRGKYPLKTGLIASASGIEFEGETLGYRTESYTLNNGAILKADNSLAKGTYLIKFNGNSSTVLAGGGVKNLLLDCYANSQNWANGILIQTSYLTTVESVTVRFALEHSVSADASNRVSGVDQVKVLHSNFEFSGGTPNNQSAIFFKSIYYGTIMDNQIYHANKTGIFIEGGNTNSVVDNSFDDAGTYGIYDHSRSTIITGNRFFDVGTGLANVRLDDSRFTVISGNFFTNPNADGAAIDEGDKAVIYVHYALGTSVVGNTAWDNGPGSTKYFGYELGVWSAPYGVWVGNNMWGSEIQRMVITDSSKTIVQGNYGFKTSNSGSGTYSNNDWVPHGLAGTPTTVVLTPRINVAVWVNARNSTHFQIGVASGSPTIDWYVEYKP